MSRPAGTERPEVEHLADAESAPRRPAAPLSAVGPRPVVAPRGRRGRLMRRALLLADVAGLLLALAATALATADAPLGGLSAVEEVLIPALWLGFWIVGAKLFGLYERDEERADHSSADDLAPVFVLVTVGIFLLDRLGTLAGVSDIEDAALTLFWALGVGAVTVARTIARTIARRSEAYLQNTVIVGAGDVGRLLARKLLAHPEYGLNLVGFVGSESLHGRTHVDHVPVLGALEALPDIVQARDVDRVVFAFSLDSHREHLHVVRRLRERGVQIDIVPRLFEVIGPEVGIHTVEGLALIGLPPVRPSASMRTIKRAIDIVGSAALLVISAPLFVVAAVLIKRDSPGPVLFRQQRLGQDRREFCFLKFRTMTVDADDRRHRDYIEKLMHSDAAPGPNGLFKLERDDAVTPVGRWLRRTSLDELPQLINVLLGQMSLVGPRPCLPFEVEHFAPHHFERFVVPAGMTGLWQVDARAHATFVEALDMDVLYAQSASLTLDLRLLARTPLQLLRSGATS